MRIPRFFYIVGTIDSSSMSDGTLPFEINSGDKFHGQISYIYESEREGVLLHSSEIELYYKIKINNVIFEKDYRGSSLGAIESRNYVGRDYFNIFDKYNEHVQNQEQYPEEIQLKATIRGDLPVFSLDTRLEMLVYNTDPASQQSGKIIGKFTDIVLLVSGDLEQVCSAYSSGKHCTMLDPPIVKRKGRC